MRRPDWRAVRAILLAEQVPRRFRAERHDDYFVRAYRHYVIEMTDGYGDEERRRAVCRELPHVHKAHELHFKSDPETRQILQAWLLTREEFSDIGDRVATESAVVEHFEQLFFNVRDRLDCSGWIAKVIRGPRSSSTLNCETKWELERGIFYRMIAFYGGPIALNALISGGTLGERPKSVEDIIRHFNDVLPAAVQRQATLAALDLPLDPASVMRILSLGKRRRR
jgi:hypothetical protein